MKKIAFALLLCLSLILPGCYKDAQQIEPTSNHQILVELLFEKDGCRIYRFRDGIHDVYWTDCRGKMESIHQQSTGKTSREVRIQNETITNP